MNKKILVIISVLMTISMLTIPSVSALSRALVERIAVTHIGLAAPSYSPLSPPKLRGGDPPRVVTFHISVVVPISLTIHSLPTEEILVGTSESEVKGIRHNNVVEGTTIGSRTIHFAKGSWIFPGGTFEGDYIYVVNQPDMAEPANMKIIQMKLYGTGEFEGQTLVLTYDGPQIGASFSGFLYRPLS
jgi:hypothetical protein